MKRVIAALGVLAIAASAASAQTPGPNTVVGSWHDFTTAGAPKDTAADGTVLKTYGFYTRSSAVCSSCHTAHNAISQDAPLWIHDATGATFTPYWSATMNSIPGQPGGVTRACLGCHDGTVAINAVNGATITGGTVTGEIFIDPAYSLGANLADDHPVSMTYDETADPGLRAKSLVAAQNYPLYGGNKDQVECGSCHNPHAPGTNGLFFRNYNTATYKSRCLVCHNK